MSHGLSAPRSRASGLRRPFAVAVCLVLLGAPAAAESSATPPVPTKDAAQGSTGTSPAAAAPTGGHEDAASAREHRRKALAGVKSWGYQLRLLRPPQVAASPFDLVVIDHAISEGGRHIAAYGSELLQMIRKRPDGSRRIVLAYLSIGEAERYRFYWKPEWADSRPTWLGGVNPQWDGNYTVRYWDPDWQRIIVGGPNSYLERIKAAGFDGIYLDRADIFQEFSRSRPSAEREMAAFIAKIAQAARRDAPHFLVVMQNAEELLRHANVITAIDGIAKEDLFYGENHDGQPNPAGTVATTLSNLRIARRAGKRVLVVEYVDSASTAAALRRRANAEGFVIHFARRDLGSLMTTAPDQRNSE